MHILLFFVEAHVEASMGPFWWRFVWHSIGFHVAFHSPWDGHCTFLRGFSHGTSFLREGSMRVPCAGLPLQIASVTSQVAVSRRGHPDKSHITGQLRDERKEGRGAGTGAGGVGLAHE